MSRAACSYAARVELFELLCGVGVISVHQVSVRMSDSRARSFSLSISLSTCISALSASPSHTHRYVDDRTFLNSKDVAAGGDGLHDGQAAASAAASDAASAAASAAASDEVTP